MTKLISVIQARLAAARDDETGATMVEYGLLVALIAVVALGAVQTLGGDVAGAFTDIATAIP